MLLILCIPGYVSLTIPSQCDIILWVLLFDMICLEISIGDQYTVVFLPVTQ